LYKIGTTDHHNITERLLKVALNTITLTLLETETLPPPPKKGIDYFSRLHVD
jgi:hypothetical protein